MWKNFWHKQHHQGHIFTICHNDLAEVSIFILGCGSPAIMLACPFQWSVWLLRKYHQNGQSISKASCLDTIVESGPMILDHPFYGWKMQKFVCDLLWYENRGKCTGKRLQNITFASNVIRMAKTNEASVIEKKSS